MRDRHRVDDGELAGVPQRPQRRETRRQAERVVERRQVGGVVGERAAQRAVVGVAVRHERREAVEAAAQQDEHEPPALGDLREVDDRQAEGGDAAVAHGSDEVAALHHYLHWNAGPATASAMRSGAEIGGVRQQSVQRVPRRHVHDVNERSRVESAASPAVSRSCGPARRG